MKEEDPQPLVPVTDEVMEARIVAWVLGEASAFEIAELERLCAEQPALEQFRRRMLALQGLLQEAMVPAGDGADWKLPAGKRGVLEEAFGMEAVEHPVKVTTRRRVPARQWIGAGMGIAASVTFAWVIWRMGMQGDGGRGLAVGESSLVYAAEKEGEMASVSSSSRARPRITPPAVDGFSLADNESKRLPAPSPAPVTGGRGDVAKADIDAVRRGLYMAEGSYNLGKYDDAKREYEDVLRRDPDNSAARGGLERIATAKSDYYRAGYDHSRAELLSEAAGARELPVPGQPVTPLPLPTEPAAALDSLAVIPPQEPGNGPFFFAEGKAEGTGVGAGMGFGMEDRSTDSRAQGSPPSITKIDFAEVTAAEEAFSTFSLNVSDVSFQLAKAALMRGETPAPESIQVEQFYNAVDYSDPAPGGGEQVAGVVEQSAHPVIPGRNLVRLGIRTAAAGRAKSQPLRLTLLIDQSGSMVREDRRVALNKAIADLSGLLTPADRVSIIGFSRKPHILLESQPGDQLADLAKRLNPEAAEGGTNLEEALKVARDIALRTQLDGAQNRIVLFTDGAANLGDADPARLSTIVAQMRGGGLAFDVAGIGTEDLNDRLLADLARNGNGRYYIAAENLASQLAGAFRPAAEDVKVQVKFNPDRVSRYKLIGFEQSRLNTEDFRNDAVDAAELSAEEAAVALYQVELLPGGDGEIGMMSVRFRDAGSSSTVERSWSIPFDAAAPAFDRATPSMQLAGLSMLAAEKLKGGPYGQAINFRNFSSSIFQVKHYYAGSGSVSDMLQMIDTLSR